MLHDHADICEFLSDRKKVVLLDNNIVASRHGIKQLEYCRDNGIAVDCNQGMDARIICKSGYLCDLIADVPSFGTKGIRIACDQDNEIEPCHTVIQKVLEKNPKKTFIVYCILTEEYEDSVRRVLEWRKYGHSVAVYAPPIGILPIRSRSYQNGRKTYQGGQVIITYIIPAIGKNTESKCFM